MSKRILEDWLEGYIDYTKNSEPPYTFHLWVAISILSSVLQRKCKLPWGSLLFYPNIYVVLVAPSGEARKGTAMGPAFEFLTDLGVNLTAEATTREALIRYLGECEDNTTNSSGGFERHASMTIFAPELTVFLGYQNHQLLSDLTDWYDCRDKWIYRTKHEGTDDITGVYVNLIGATTPDLIRTVMPLDAIGGGLTSRMIFVFEEKKGKIVPYPMITKEEIALRVSLKTDLEHIFMMRGEFKTTSRFLEEWIKWYTVQDANPPFRDPRFNGYIQRRANHIMKLSMICCASRSGEMIVTHEDLDRAIGILKLTERKMLKTFAGVGKSQHADILVQVMNEIGMKGETTKAELLDIFHHDADSWTMDHVLKTLEDMKFARIERQPGTGTTKVIYLKEEEPEDDSSL